MTLGLRLTRPARLLTVEEVLSGVSPARTRAPDPPLLLILDQPDADPGAAFGAAPGTAPAIRVRVDGPIDGATAGQLNDELRRRSRAGSRTMILDLSGVTHLASAGVAVLHAAVRGASPGTPLRLYAAVDSPAGQVLSLVALPYEPRDPRFVTG